MHSTSRTARLLLACFTLTLLIVSFKTPSTKPVPITGVFPDFKSITHNEEFGHDLDDFIGAIKTGDASELVGIYVPGVLAVPVLQQPDSDPNFVSTELNTVTQFAAAADYGTTGLLAHNYLTGAEFFKISGNQEFYLVYGDGTTMSYTVTEIQKFQALDPESPYSDFVDLAGPGNIITAGDVFNRIYTRGGDQVVLQTCIEKDGNGSWGRIFIIASPNGEVALSPAPEPVFQPSAIVQYHLQAGHIF